MDILTGETLLSIKGAKMDLIYGSFRSSSGRGGDGVKGWMGGIVIVASCEYFFIRLHKHLV